MKYGATAFTWAVYVSRQRNGCYEGKSMGQVATVMVETVRIDAAAQIVPSYSPVDVAHRHLTHCSLSPNKFTPQTASWSIPPFCVAHCRDQRTDIHRQMHTTHIGGTAWAVYLASAETWK